MSSPQDDLRHLIDRLPQHAVGELLSFALYLEHKEQAKRAAPLRDPLEAVPLDDEPFSAQERAEAAAALADYKQHGGISLEALMNELDG